MLEELTEQVRLGGQPDQLALDVPAVHVGSPENGLHARLSRDRGELSLQDLGGDVRHLDQIAVIRGEEPILEKQGVDDPEEVLEAAGHDLLGGEGCTRLHHEWERRTEKVAVILFQAAPQPDPAVEILGELDQEPRQGLELGFRQSQRVVRQVLLRLDKRL